MAAQVQTKKYPFALKKCENMIPIVQGGVTRRPGTVFVGEVKDSSKETRIVPFEFSTTQAYILEFGDYYIRVFKDRGAVLESSQVITGVSQANPGVLTYVGADPTNGDTFYLTGIVGMAELNEKLVSVANVNAGANTFELQDTDGNDIDTSGYSAYASDGTMARIYTVTSPYPESVLSDLKFTQSADVLYITHPDYAPRKLSRTGHAAWTFSVIAFQDGPWLPINISATTLTPSGTTGSITITASADTFVATDVGRLIRLKNTTWGYAKITAYTSSTIVAATVFNTLGGTTATTDWRLGIWSETTGYPSCTAFYEDRLFFGGSKSSPQRVDGSRSSEYENFAPTASDGTVVDSHALAFVLNSSDVNVIRWMADDEKGLLVGTVGGEWILRASTLSEAMSATNATAKRSTSSGSANTPSVRVGKSALYIQRSGRKMRELAYVYEVDGFRSPDMTVMSEHITTGGILALSYQQEPWSIVWSKRGDGQLIGLTYEREQDVIAWHRHIIGGSFNSGIAEVESIATIPNIDGTADETYLIVKRTINGVTRRYIEYISGKFESGLLTDAFFVDCGLTYSGSPVTTISGLDHLEGETVSILSNGATHPDRIVTNGSITLVAASESVSVGLTYLSDIETLNIEAGAADGTAQGKTKRIHRVTLRLFETLGLKYGPNESSLDVLTFRAAGDSLNQPPALFTGDKSFNWNGYYETSGTVYLRQDQPLPFTVLGLFPQLVTQDR